MLAKPGFAGLPPLGSLELSQEDARVLGLDAHGLAAAARDILSLAILCASENGPPTANLLAPVVVNLKASVAAQAVSKRQPLFPSARSSRGGRAAPGRHGCR